MRNYPFPIKKKRTNYFLKNILVTDFIDLHIFDGFQSITIIIHIKVQNVLYSYDRSFYRLIPASLTQCQVFARILVYGVARF